jgi:nucleoside-diphosphate-sugar epimerase
VAATALITGASGLVGSWTLRHWDRTSTEPVPLSSADVDLLEPGEPTALVERLRPDVVVHLAWSAGSTPGYRHSPDNDRWLVASLELHQACLRHGARFWATGTVVDDAADPSDEYTNAKVALRRDLAGDVDAGNIGWLRPTYVFDQAARSPAVVAHALAARLRDEPVQLQTPDLAHDFVHASDVGAAVAAAVRYDRRGLLPVGSGRLHRVAELVDALGVDWRRSDSVAPPTSHTGSPADVTWLREIGWKPTTTEEFFGDD